MLHRMVRAVSFIGCPDQPCYIARSVNDMKDLNDTSGKDDVEYSDTWTEEDLQDLSTFALSHSENPHETDTNTPKP
jgi:hypothetical protein